MNGDPRYGNIPLSQMGAGRSPQPSPAPNIQAQLQDISDKVERAIRVNIELQEKITQLGRAITDLGIKVEAISSERSPPMEETAEEESFGLPQVPAIPDLGLDEEIPEEPLEEDIEEPAKEEKPAAGLPEQIKELTEQNLELVKTLKSIDKHLSKGSSKDRIRKALETTGAV